MKKKKEKKKTLQKKKQLGRVYLNSVFTLKEIYWIPGNLDCFRVIFGKQKIPGNSGKLRNMENM